MLPTRNQKNLSGIIVKGFSLERFARKNYAGPLIRIMPTRSLSTISIDEAIAHTDLTKALLLKKISAIVVPGESSPLIRRWSRETGIRLIGTPLALQTKLEDKIYFDTLLRTWGISVPRRVTVAEITQRPSGRFVIQKRRSSGAHGTRIVPGGGISSDTVSKENTLIRVYESGTPLGVSIFIDHNGNYFCSALRRQCFEEKTDGTLVFIGVQWIPTTSIKRSARVTIERTLAQLADMLISESFIGVANIDFILHGNRVYIIECNPRFSIATPQVFQHSFLTTHPHAWQFYIHTFLGRHNGAIRNPHIPITSYAGATLDRDCLRSEHIDASLDVGPYTVRNGAIRKIKKFGSASVFITHDLPKNCHLKKGETIYSLTADVPLFSGGDATNDLCATVISICDQAMIV